MGNEKTAGTVAALVPLVRCSKTKVVELLNN